MKTNTKLWLGAVTGLLITVGGLAGVKVAQIRTLMAAAETMRPPPESVTTAVANSAEWENSREAVATLVAVRAVLVSTEIAGTVRQIGFEAGALVKQGSVLVKLDTSTEEAQLAAAEAEASLAQSNLERTRSLRAQDAIPVADLDAAEARAKQTSANVKTLQTTIAKKTIRAPFDGRIAIRQVELGQVISPGAPIASLQSVTPIYGEFWLPEQALAKLKLGERVTMSTDTYAGETWEGQLSTINPEVDTTTRNVRVRATFPNVDGRLRPGMFSNVRVLSAEKREVLTIPATAVIYAPFGDSVFVIEEARDSSGHPGQVARQRFVRLGERRGDFVAVVSGLKKGETVVSTGAFKLKNGTPVVVNNELAPTPELDPKPADR